MDDIAVKEDRMKKNAPGKSLIKHTTSATPSQADFDQVLTLINAARIRAYAAVNTTLIDLYWSIGEYISHKIAQDGWGKGTVALLAQYIRQREPNARGYSAQNLSRMRQFYETYRHQ